MSDLDDMLDEYARERRERVRKIGVGHSADRTSGGVELRIPTGHMTTVLDLNVHELRAWAQQMIVWADAQEDPCPYTHAHTRDFCGRPGCRES